MSEYENNLNGLENEAPTEEAAEAVQEVEIINDEPVVEKVSAPVPEPSPAPVYSQPVYQYSQPAYQQSASHYYTNEYTYNPEPAPAKKGKGGKIALSVLAGILGVFVVVVLTVAVYTAILRTNGVVLPSDSYSDNDLPDFHNGMPDYSPDTSKTPDVTESDQPNEESKPAATINEDYPTIEQLAAPEDAMSIPDIYDKVSPSVVGISSTSFSSLATGTGIIISEDGYIITNAHVIDGAEKVNVLLNDGTDYDAEIVGYDTQSDLAVLKSEANGLVPCEFGVSNDMRVGELVVAIGNPLGFDLYGSITSGILSGKNRTVVSEDKEMNLLQTTAPINAGNSGGPLIDAYGRVIGINTIKYASTDIEGLGFAIPIDDAIPVINDIMKYGYATGRPMLGISGEDINALISAYFRLPQGVYVREVTEGSGAEKAGIRVDDIVIGADGETVTCMNDLNLIKRRHAAGDVMTITIYRDGKAIDLEVTLDEASQAG